MCVLAKPDAEIKVTLKGRWTQREHFRICLRPGGGMATRGRRKRFTSWFKSRLGLQLPGGFSIWGY